MPICYNEIRGFYAVCDKCEKEIDLNLLSKPEDQLKKLGWSVKYNYRYNKTICPECLKKNARKLEKHFGLFDLLSYEEMMKNGNS